MRQRAPGRLAFLAAATAGLLACAGAPPIPDVPQTDRPEGYEAATPATLAAQGWTVCPIARRDSQLEIRVAPGGKLARLGHHHVLSTDRIGGFVAARGGELQADLFLAATDLVVDDASVRAAAGGPYADEVPEKDRAGTRGNMLGPRVLAADEYPWLRVTTGAFEARRVGSSPPALLRIAGRTIGREFGVDRFDEGRITGRTEFTHEALGLEPFTALGGALSVADPIEVRYELVLDAAEDPACGTLSAPALTR